MRLSVRRASALDTAPMAALLNDIIAAGGTTAMTSPVTGDTLLDWMQSSPNSAWHSAEQGGEILGFQYIGPHQLLPPEACDIATFVQRGRTGLGIGSALFNATAKAAEDLGFDWISASIRSDNAGGRAYYQSRGFRLYGERPDQTLDNGLVVCKVLTRYDIR